MKQQQQQENRKREHEKEKKITHTQKSTLLCGPVLLCALKAHTRRKREKQTKEEN